MLSYKSGGKNSHNPRVTQGFRVSSGAILPVLRRGGLSEKEGGNRGEGPTIEGRGGVPILRKGEGGGGKDGEEWFKDRGEWRMGDDA